MSRDLTAALWPAPRLGEALHALATQSGLVGKSSQLPDPQGSLDSTSLGPWMETAAASLGLEAEPAGTTYPQLAGHLAVAGPALIRMPGNFDAPFFAVLRGNRRTLSLLAPDFSVQRRSTESVRAALTREMEAPIAAEVDRLLEDAGVPTRRRGRTKAAILQERLGSTPIENCWILRRGPGAPFWRHLRDAGLPSRLAWLGAAHFAEYLLWIAAWWLMGEAALSGRLDRGWLMAWGLLLLTMVPLRLVSTWLQGLMGIGVGGLLKLRLLAGALRLEPDEIRHQGAGELLGRVIESEAVESLALTGGFLAMVAVIELALSGAVLYAGAGGGLQALSLVGWVAVTCWIGWRFFGDDDRWTQARLEMTHDLVERMVGHRTRLAQEARERWHDGEDQAVDRYVGLSARMDRSGAYLMAFVPRGWLLIGLAGVAPAFISRLGSTAGLAVSLGGVLLALGAFKKLAGGLANLVGAAIAWKQVELLFHAAARPQAVGSPSIAMSDAPGKLAVAEGHDLVFRYRDRGEPVLRRCTLRVAAGDRVLLEGPSGGGKSTLAALLIGLRVPESGLLLAGGLDRHTLGSDGWRRRVASAPQFHENHVLTGTFAFNLLMGRGDWRAADYAEAETVCAELGLGDLLQRMPAGMLQMVGETGWQLSHGERSRLFIARALLQNPDLMILDESFAALDPENLHRALECVLRRARTLLVIAHR
jgi:ATP-binding cassette subfamily B protein